MKDIFIKVAVESALKAGEYIFSRKGRIKDIAYKGAINLVTDVDKGSERMIVKNIKRYFPSHGILSEEEYTERRQAEYIWIIDPLDGTTNYSRGLGIYSVSIGLECRGEIVLGVVYDPERRELFTAEKGKGARLNKKRISVSSTVSLRKAFLVTGFAYDIRTTTLDNIEYFESFLKRALAVRRLGSAALDLCYVACGRFDGFWEMNLHPWDSAAGSLIVKEAGGKVTRFDKTSYSHYDKELLATNPGIHKKMIKVFKSIKK